MKIKSVNRDFIELETFAKSVKGYCKTDFQDSFLVDNERGLYIISDCNGLIAGENASQLVIKHILDELDDAPENFRKSIIGELDDEAIIIYFADLIRKACNDIYEINKLENQNITVTLTMAIKLKYRFLICHIGNSRAYLISKKSVHKITNDHNLYEDLSKKGIHKKALKSDLKQTLTRSIGNFPYVEIDCAFISCIEKDRLIIISDKLAELISDPVDLLSIASKNSPQEAVLGLLEYSLDNGGRDNATALVIDVMTMNKQMEIIAARENLILEVLRNCLIFDGLSFSDISRLRIFFKEVSIENSENLNSQFNKGLVIILDGCLSDGNNLITRNEYFGESTLIKDIPYRQDLYAIRQAKLLILSEIKFDLFSKRYPDISNKILRNIIHFSFPNTNR